MAKKPVQSVKSFDETRKAELYVKLSAWHTAVNKQAEWRAKELELRSELAAFFKDATEGTNTLELDYGKALKLNVKVNRSVDRAQLEAFKNLAIAAKDEDALKLLDTVVAYDPKVVVGEWKKLPKEDVLKLSDIITEKPGTPELSIETPKG